MVKFGDRVKELRKEKGIPQEDFAKAIGVSKGTVSVWERGVRIPEFDTLHGLCDYFAVPLGYLLGTSDDRQHSDEPDDMMAAEGLIVDEARSIASIANTMARLSQSSRTIIAGAINAAYREDKTKDALEPPWRYDVKVSVRFRKDGPGELIDAHDDT